MSRRPLGQSHPLDELPPDFHFTPHFTLFEGCAIGVIMIVALDPLTAPLPPEVPLSKAPLVRVICQVRFPLIVAVEQRDTIAPFQEAIRGTYPVLREERTQAVLVGPTGIGQAAPNQIVWRFHDIDAVWRVSLAPDFVALETTRYTSRAEFLDRLRQVLDVLEEHVQPKLIDRLGVRYVDRVAGPEVLDLPRLVRAEVCGIAGTAAAAHLQHSITESMFVIDHEQLLARWGKLPPQATIDPTIEPINEPSWILDLDMFSTERAPFDVDRVLAATTGYCERIYGVFRWAVTDEFLRRFGGNL